MKKILAVDLDDTVFPSSEYWHHYLELETKLGIPWSVVEQYYNISTLYKDELFKRSLDPMAFWRATNTYDCMIPYQTAQKALEKASKKVDIVFVSALKGGHHKSKYECVKRHFPYMSGFCGTKEKQFIRCDAIIDDRKNNLELFKDLDVKTIWCKTETEQFSDYEGDAVLHRWEDLEGILEGWKIA